MFPKELTRTTNHRPPRYQIYQPGFNPENSCWLQGAWITIPKGEYTKRQEAHTRLYKDLRKEVGSQHHRNKGTALKNMTEAQRQAFEFYSGTNTLSVERNGAYGLAEVDMAGKKVSQKSIEWLRQQGYKVLRFVVNEQTDKQTEQTRGLGLPDDLILETAEPVDVWKHIVAQNKANQREMARGAFNLAQGEMQLPGTIMGLDFRSFAFGMSIHGLLEIEEEIMRGEYMLAKGTPDRFTNLDEERAEYVKLRAELAQHPQFEELYEAQKKEHNESERANLDNSEGQLFCWVLPKFYADGSHEPWGPRDVPWAAEDD